MQLRSLVSLVAPPLCVGCGAAAGTTLGAALVPAGAPVGSLRAVPASSGRLGSSPFIQASRLTLIPLRAAIELSVSP